MDAEPERIEYEEFDAAALMRDFPPRWYHPNKQQVYGIACPAGFAPQGRLGYSRWRAVLPPARFDPHAAVARTLARESPFDYEPLDAVPAAVEWHVNFADPELFVAYGSGLLAQDEMQVAEHPVLGSLREALVAQSRATVTVDDEGATPVLITGAERRCRIATDPDAALGRPAGLYGNQFARGTPDTIRKATARLDPPTVTHLIAMAAIPGGEGEYTPLEIAYTLSTAYSGFRAAVLESARVFGARPVVVHTGFWGCGAFGGNRILMTLVQILAAQAAGVDTLVFHTLSGHGTRAWDQACALVSGVLRPSPPPTTVALCERIATLGLTWGMSDGN